MRVLRFAVLFVLGVGLLIPIRPLEAQGNVSCSDFTNSTAAQAVLDSDPDDPFQLDLNGNGVACDDATPSTSPESMDTGYATPGAIPLGVPAGTEVAVVEDHRDGRTLVVRIGDQRKRVVLAGTDVPSSSVGLLGECFAVESFERLQNVVPIGSTVYLESGIPDRDRNRALLRYVWIASKNQGRAILVNRKMIRDGFATYGGTALNNSIYVGILQDAESSSRDEQRGLWKTCGGPHVKIQPPPAILGDKVQFGSWQIIANDSFSQQSAGSYNPQAARGTFLIVSMTIQNIASQPQTFPFDSFRVTDSQGRTFTVATQATSYLASDSGTGMYEQLQPDLPYQFFVAFDVPIDAGGFLFSTSGSDFQIAL